MQSTSDSSVVQCAQLAEFATVKYEKVANELENCLLECADVFSVVVVH